MERFARVCRALALLALGAIVLHRLPPPLGPDDDWELVGLWPRSWVLGALAAALLALPGIVRYVRNHRRVVFYGLAAVVVAFLVFAVSIPSLLRARMGGGLSVGGARDVDLFRQSLQEGFLPRPTDLTTAGLYADYYFDTLPGATTPDGAGGLFQPVFSWARIPEPERGETETFLAVGLRSAEETARIQRPPLRLCIVLDISGSMRAGLGAYFYDATAKAARSVRDVEAAEADPDAHASKMQVATHVVAAVLERLRPDDRLGIVLFDDRAYVAKRMRRVGDTDLDALRRHVLALEPRGGTNMEAGLEAARALLRGHEDAGQGEAETRILFLTDAMPNQGQTGASGLAELADRYARDRVHATFVGIGVDFQTELVEKLTRVRGANYVAVHSAAEFRRRLAGEFDHLVTPWAYDLRLRLDGARIEAAYGVPEGDLGAGELLHVKTLFPAPVEDQAVKGGIILLRLDPGSLGSTPLRAIAEYEDRAGRTHRIVTRVPPPPDAPDLVPGAGVRKAVLLARYATLVRDWLSQEAGGAPPQARSSWERRSRPLHVSPELQRRFGEFHRYFQAESALIDDPDLAREEEVLARLSWVETRVDAPPGPASARTARRTTR